MNTIFKKGNFYISPRNGNHIMMMVSIIKSNGEDCLYCMSLDGSYVTIPYWQLDYYKELTPSQYSAMNTKVLAMRCILEAKVPQPVLQEESAIDPPHYGGKDNPYEAIKVIEAWELDFCLGNVVKYISRAGKKNKDKELEDLLKAQWYLNKHIETWQEEKH